MALFDLQSAMSREVPAAHDLATALASTAAWQALCEAPGDANAAMLKIGIGPEDDPFDGTRFTRDELRTLFVRATIGPDDETPYVSVDQGSEAICPLEAISLLIYVRRFVREEELAAPDGLRNTFAWFWDCVSALHLQLHYVAGVLGAPRLVSIERREGPKFGPVQDRTEQGDYLWATLAVKIGDPVGG